MKVNNIRDLLVLTASEMDSSKKLLEKLSDDDLINRKAKIERILRKYSEQKRRKLYGFSSVMFFGLTEVNSELKKRGLLK